MAQLTDQLANANGIIPAPVLEKGPSPLAMGLNALSEGIQVFDQTRKEGAARKRQAEADARQARMDAEKDQEKEASNWLTQAVIGSNKNGGLIAVEDTSSVEDPGIAQNSLGGGVFKSQEATALEGEAAAAARKVILMDTAVAQGKMPAISRTAAIDKIVQSFVNKYPGVDQQKIIGSVMATMGVQNSLNDETKAEEAQKKASQDMALDFRKEAYKTATSNLGPEAISQLSEDELVMSGAKIMEQDAKFKRQVEQINLTNSIASAAQKEVEFNRQETGIALEQGAFETLAAQLGPQIEAVTKGIRMVGQPGANAGLEQQLADISVALEQNKGRVIGNIITTMGITDPAAAERTRTRLEGWFDTTFTQPLNSRNKSYGLVAETMKNKLGLDVITAMPFISALQEAGLRVDAMQPILDKFLSDKGNADRLGSELKGLTNLGMGTNSAKIQLSNIVSMLNGNSTLQDHPETAKQNLSVLSKVSLDYGSQVVKGDLTNGDYYITSMGTVVSAAGTLTQNSGLAANVNAAVALSGHGRTRTALDRLAKDAQFSNEARVIGQGSRAAAAKVYSNLRRTVPALKNGYWSTAYDSNQGQWKAVFDQKAWDSRQAKAKGILAASSPTLGVLNSLTGDSLSRSAVYLSGKNFQAPEKPPVPQDIQKAVSATNSLLDHLAYTVSWEDDAPKGTLKEVKDFYTRDRLTPDMRKQVQSQKAEKTSDGQILKTLVDLEAQLTAGEFKFATPTVGGDAERIITGGGSGNLGIGHLPEEVKTLGQAVEFGKSLNNRGQESSAMGLFQITQSTMADFAPRVLGENWKEQPFNAASQDKVAEAIFNASNGSAASLKGRWVSLTNEEAEVVRKMPWSQARKIIAGKESGASL